MILRRPAGADPSCWTTAVCVRTSPLPSISSRVSPRRRPLPDLDEPAGSATTAVNLDG